MPKDLESKIASLVQDIEKMNQIDRIKTISRFMKHEFEMIEAPRTVSMADLVQIQSRAATIMRELPGDLHLDGKRLHDYPDRCRTICMVQATYEFFRSQKMTPYILSFGPRNENGVK